MSNDAAQVLDLELQLLLVFSITLAYLRPAVLLHPLLQSTGP